MTEKGSGRAAFFSGSSARIIAAAEAWLAAHPYDVNNDIRFDVVGREQSVSLPLVPAKAGTQGVYS